MKTTLSLFVRATYILMIFALSSCASNMSYQQALDKNRRSLESMEKLEDAQFMVEAQSFNLLEQRINQLAIEKGYSADLVKFARKNAESYEDLGDELSKVSRKEKIKIPSEMKTEHEQKLQELSATARSDFDARYVDVLREINEENTELFEEQASEANDAEIRAFAAAKLGVLRATAEEISQVDDQLMQTHR
jgi:putative membrane protein